MTPLRANAFLANRGERLGCFVFESCPPPGGQAAPAVCPPSAPAGAGVSCDSGGTAPALPGLVPAMGGSGGVTLSDAVMVLAGAVAAYERCGLARAVEIALCAYAEKIGCGVLARAVADAGESHDRERGGAREPCAGARGEVLFTVPEFRRVGENRFRGGGP